MTLVERLANLDCGEDNYGIWVNPENPNEEWRIGSDCFENGGVLDNWVYVGSLAQLSFGFQSVSEAVEAYIKEAFSTSESNHLIESYKAGTLDGKTYAEFLTQAEVYMKTWAEAEAHQFVFEKIPEIIKDSKNF